MEQFFLDSWLTLTSDKLYEILKLRAQVFVVEQHCHYLDLDDQDQNSDHFGFEKKGKVIAYLRVINEQDSYRIGRVCTHIDFRGQGLASKLMNEAMEYLKKAPRKEKIVLSAQQHLVDYYAQWGFVPKGKPYLDVGILHQDMLLADGFK